MSPVRARILQIRRTVAAVAVTVFIALFSAIYVQMASGNDPALGTGTTTSTSTTSSSSAPSAVTTRQS
jgi:hypothetical protein